MKLSLNDYDKIIFDMDGVLTAETAYWEAAALSCYELLFSHEYYGKSGIDDEWCRRRCREIYDVIFCGERTVRAVKRLGVNTNWDLAYVVFCVSRYVNPELDILDSAHFESVCMFIENIQIKPPELYDTLGALAATTFSEYDEAYFKRGGDFFWKSLDKVFDKWYHGTAEFDGVKTGEGLLFEDDEIKAVLEKLKAKGIRLGIGTGRPRAEIEFPLEAHGINEYFDKAMYVTLDEVYAAEKELGLSYPLAKPDPYVFLKAVLGEKHTNTEIHEGDYTYEELERALIVGDAASDLFAAQKGGFDFAAVLTGVEGKAARSFFEENKADYILDDFLELGKL